LITDRLKKTPMPLSDPIWKPLQKYRLIRTPREQQNHLFQNSPDIFPPGTRFSINVQRALLASLALHERTKDVAVRFVNGGGVDLDILYTREENLLRVHEKWLNFHDIHETTSCDLYHRSVAQGTEFDVFDCDHVIQELYGMAVKYIFNDTELTQKESMAHVLSLRDQAREKLRQMPRSITVTPNEHLGEA